MPTTGQSAYNISLCSQQISETPFREHLLRMRKLRFRKFKSYVQGHTEVKGSNLDSHSDPA